MPSHFNQIGYAEASKVSAKLIVERKQNETKSA